MKLRRPPYAPRLLLIALIGAIALPIAAKLEIDVWNECRGDHSFLYCMRVVSR